MCRLKIEEIPNESVKRQIVSNNNASKFDDQLNSFFKSQQAADHTINIQTQSKVI